MFVIDFGNQQWHRRIHAKGRGITDHWIACQGKSLFRLAGDIPGETRENQITIEGRFGRLYDHGLNGGRHVAREPPCASFRIRLAPRAIRSRQRGDLKLGMALQQLNEALAHHSSRAKNSYTKFVSHLISQERRQAHRPDCNYLMLDPEVPTRAVEVQLETLAVRKAGLPPLFPPSATRFQITSVMFDRLRQPLNTFV